MSYKVPFYTNTPTKKEVLSLVKPMMEWDLSHGKYVENLERKFAQYIGSKYAVAVNSATSGIFLCLQRLNAKYVKIPSMTFVSVANVAVHTGAGIGFEDRITPGAAYNIKVDGGDIIDSAHEIYKDHWSDMKKKYKKARFSVYSFYPTKNLASCEGGMIVTDSERDFNWLRKARSHGMDRKGYSWKYTVEFPGWKMNMNNLQAVLAEQQMNSLEKNNALRDKIVNQYDNAFGLKNTGNHIYRINVKNKKQFMKMMDAAGIQCSFHFIPIHLQPAYNSRKREMKKTMLELKTSVSIPLFPQMTQKQIDYVIEKTLKYAKFV